MLALTNTDHEQFARVVQEVKNRAEGFLYTGASTIRVYCPCSRTVHPSECIELGLAPDERVDTQVYSTVTDHEESECFWLGSDVIGEHLGSGWYSNVYQAKFNDELVIKIGTGQGKDGDIFRDGWLDYAHYCLVNGPGLILPGIESVQILPEDGVYVALLHKYEKEVSMVREADRKKIYSKRSAIIDGLRGHIPNSPVKHPLYYNSAVQVRRGLLRIVEELNYDLHDGNFMVTRHGRVVLTDPLCTECSDETKDFLVTLRRAA